MSKRILIFHSSNDLYGASKILIQVIDLLNKNGYETHVFLPYKGPLDHFFDEKQKNYHERISIAAWNYKKSTRLGGRL